MNKGKQAIRKLLLQKRSQISLARRAEASRSLLLEFIPKMAPFSTVLSFMSTSQELNTHPLNRHLAEEGSLVLPKIIGQELHLYRVDHLEELIVGPFQVWEPRDTRKPVYLREIESVLVPGVGFDSHHHRIGYGKGYYDRLLSTLSCPTYGVGFQEQLVEELPIEDRDVPLTHICLY